MATTTSAVRSATAALPAARLAVLGTVLPAVLLIALAAVAAAQESRPQAPAGRGRVALSRSRVGG
jgi:hypothetical protein